MRLVLFGPGHPFRGGIARTTTELARALGSAGHEVVYLTPRSQYPRWLFPGGTDVDPEACPRLPNAEQMLDPFAPMSWPACRDRALCCTADAWLLPYWTWAWSGLWVYLLQGDRRPPAVAVVHNLADHEGGVMARLAARLVLERCQALFTHARALGDRLREQFPFVPIASHVLPPAPLRPVPARADARRRLAVPEDCRLALFVGLIRHYKGVDVLLEAFSGIPEETDWRLLVVGEPWQDLGGELREQVRTMNLGERVRLDLRWVDETELPVLLGAADLVVLPYRRASQSAVAPMALAHGVPVLGTTVGGLPELVSHGVNGVLVEPGSAEALADALQGLDRDTLGDLAVGARASGRRLSWASYTLALVDLACRAGGGSSRGAIAPARG